MKARMILICVLLGLCGNAFAQDIIHTIDGRSIEAKEAVLPASFSKTERRNLSPRQPFLSPAPMYMIHTAIMARSSIAGAITLTAGEDSMPSSCRIIWVYPYMEVITERPEANTRVASFLPSAVLLW